jgi:hypothetical protein
VREVDLAHDRFRPDRSQTFRDDLSPADLARLGWALAGHLWPTGYEVHEPRPTRREDD